MAAQTHESPTPPASVSGRLWALAAFALAGVGLNVSLTQHFYEVRNGTAGFKSFCNVGSTANCDVVAASPYAELFAGLPLSSFAAGWLLALFVVALMARSPAWRRQAIVFLKGLTGAALVFSLIYLYIMAVKIKTWCLLCLGVDALNLVAFAIAWSMRAPAIPKAGRDASGQWKTMLGLTAASLAITVALLRGLDAAQVNAATTDELAAQVLNAPVLPVNAGPESPSLGPADAPITIVEFSDFQCPFCRIGAFTVHSVMQRYPAQVRVVLRNFPLDSGCNRKFERSMHPFACEAARTVVCAHKQGKFEPVYEALFDQQASFAAGKIAEIAREAGVDEAQLKACAAAPETHGAIARDVEEGLTLGIQSTPTFFINGHKMEGAYPPPVWHKVIDTLLAAGKK